jgi:PGF-pre-PGF domain-containing protein
MVLVFDPSLLSADSIVVNDILSGSKLTYYLNNSTGFANMTLSSVDVSAEGQVHVADVVFFALTSGMSNIIPENVSFENDTIFYPAEFVSNGSVRINYPPVINDIDDKVIIAGSELSFSVSATDADDLVLTYGVEGLPFGYDLNFETGYFMWIPAEADVGTHIVNFSVSDSYAFDFTQVNITVNELVIVDTPPQLEPIDNKYVNENETLSFNVTAIDPEEDAIEYSASMLPEGSSFDTSSGAFIWMPGFDDAGTYPVEFTATANDLSDSENVTITVNNVNHDPKLLNIKSQTVNEGSILEFTIGASDPDGDTLEFGMNGLPPEATLNAVTGEFSWTPDYEDAKVYDVEFSVSDGSLSDSENITITVTNVNRAPVLDLIGDRGVSEDSPLIVTLSATDADEEDSLTYDTNASFGTLDDNVFTWDTGYGDAGTYIVEFNVSDGIAVDSEVVEITVDDVNRAPVLDLIGERSVSEDSALIIILSGNDADKDPLTYGTNASFGTLTDNVFVWTPDYDDAGTYVVEFTVSDGFAVDSEIIAITVTDVNRAPVLDLIGDRSISEDSLLSIALSGSDADDDFLIYNTNASFGTLTGNVFEWTPDFGDCGTYIVEFSVSDGLSVDSEIITITVTDVNRAPMLMVIGSQSVDENKTLTIIPDATDDDDDTLYYSLVDSPSGSKIDETTGKFTWTPTYGQAGSYVIRFVVSDGFLKDTEDVTVTVNDVNRPPIMNAPDKVVVSENATVILDLNASDPDDDVLEYSMDASFGTLQGTLFSWTPGYEDAGIYPVTFTVNDAEFKVSKTVTINVTNSNSAPVLYSISDILVNELETVNIALEAVDIDGDELKFSKDVQYGDLEGDIFTWTPGINDSGFHKILFTVTDGQLSDSKTGTIAVGNTNIPPIIGYMEDQQVKENEMLVFTLNASDIDNDTLTYSASDLPAGADIGISNGTFTWIPTYDQAGTYTVEFMVSDKIYTAFDTVLIDVENVNRGPAFGYISGHSINETETLVIDLNATDPDGDAITFSTTSKKGDVIGDSFMWTTGYYDSGDYDLDFKVTDGHLTDNITVHISVCQTNMPPEFEYIGSYIISENETLQFSVKANDGDNDPLTYSVSGLPQGSFFNTSTGDFIWKPDYSQSGTYSVEFQVTDGKLNASRAVSIRVMDVDKTSNPSLYGFTSSSSSSGGGGSSGGSEDYENINYMDYSMKYITQGMKIVYEFSNDENDIEYVKFRAQKAASLTKTVIEVLKDRSALVSSSPSGTVYRYINIWVGDAKFNSAGYFSSAEIGFKVEKKWLSENNADPATIKLYRYSAGSWKELPTSKTDVDDTYYYYKALTSGFSSFSIVSTEKIPVSVSTVKNSTVEDVKFSYEIESRFEPEVFDSTATATNMALEPSSTSFLNLGMFLMGIIGIIAIGSVLSYRSRNESLVLSRYYNTLYAVSISVKNATKLENIRSTDYRSLYDIIIAEIKGELKK